MVTEICEQVAREPRQVAEAVRLLHDAFAENGGPPRRKLKALTIMHELMYDKNAAAELREVHGARNALWKLQSTHNSGLGESADEQIRMFATEIERTCFGSVGDPFAPIETPAPVSPGASRISTSSVGGDPFAPLPRASASDASGSFLDLGGGQRARKRDQALDSFWKLGAVVGDKLAQAGAVAQTNILAAAQAGGSSRPEGVPRLERVPEGSRPVLDISFDGLLAGEKVHYAFMQAHLMTTNPFCETAGRLLVTNYRVKFQVPKGTLHEELGWLLERGVLDVPLGLIEEVKLETPTSEAGALECKLRITTKDFRSLVFLMASVQELATVEEAVSSLSHHTASLFAFPHAAASWDRGVPRNMEGWELYDPFAEFSRMGVDTPSSQNPSSPWTLSNANHRYELCDTYPAWLVLPRSVSEQALRAAAAFRKRGRLPTMSWCGGSALGYASLWRSSQPTDGILGNGCPDDERLVRAIRDGAAGGRERHLLVVDLRPRKSAYANKVGGGGFEDYEGCRLVFGGIDNVHVVRDAWRKMGQAVSALSTEEVGSWFRDVASSGWYDVVGAVLYCAADVVAELRSRSSVLIHCSDGWDRTAQVSSLAMLCVDPHYRTVRGFLLLIQKEFCSFGHRFRTRLANGEKPSSEYSPILLQWLECVYQLTLQFPTAFEFSMTLLLHIGTEALTNRYGTFLTDSERERSDKVSPYTLSFWSSILDAGPVAEHINPVYQLSEEVLQPSPSQVNFKVWEEYWFRFFEHPRDRRRKR
eukprot:TRINITY_DN14174_c0_g1_i3.p1 TRINITY_DN14174_c0_g1~~TRINITY_DN14174_c0_g1_i3.p1  ORF type:complete len:875 (+),score=169.74 TRINITY_DN14174_c0_g1_i3:347-2626(+)